VRALLAALLPAGLQQMCLGPFAWRATLLAVALLLADMCPLLLLPAVALCHPQLQRFLSAEGRAPHQLAYDRPSPKLLAFLRKHYGEGSPAGMCGWREGAVVACGLVWLLVFLGLLGDIASMALGAVEVTAEVSKPKGLAVTPQAVLCTTPAFCSPCLLPMQLYVM
jgi:hypothetical protein